VATIKTRGGLVLTKGGRVSCSCCADAECCMYAAEYYGSLFGLEDLPDELEFILQTNGGSVSFGLAEKGASPYGIYWWPAPVGQSPVSYALRHSNTTWNLFVQETPDIDAGFEDLGGQPCLIDDPFVFGENVRFRDDFEDSYYFTDADSGAFDIALNRISLCVWESEEWLSGVSTPSGTEYYGKAELRYVENMATWYGSSLAANALGAPAKSGFVIAVDEYFGGGFIGYKQDPQNEPNGDYTILKAGPFRTETLEITK